jgi:predicted hydrocarbon binding protein
MSSKYRNNTPENDVELANAIATIFGEVGTTIGKTIIIEEMLKQFVDEHEENLKSIRIIWDEKSNGFNRFDFNFK